MNRRIFLAINLPKDIVYDLDATIAKHEQNLDTALRIMPSELWHITVLFLGNQNDESIGVIIRGMQEIVPQYRAPHITLRALTLGPTQSDPHMLWAVTDEVSSKTLGNLARRIAEALDRKSVRFEREYRQFLGHVTLARNKNTIVQKLNEAPLNDLQFTPSSIELMESFIEKGATEYAQLASVDFKEVL